MREFACVEKGERLRRVFFQNSKIPNLSLISAFRTFTQSTISTCSEVLLSEVCTSFEACTHAEVFLGRG